jgi:hypothetical protein
VKRTTITINAVLDPYRTICGRPFVWVLGSDGRKRAIAASVAVVGGTLNVSAR